MDRLYTIKETAELLRVSRAKVFQLIKSGSLRPIKIDKRTLFPESAINQFIEDRKSERE